MIVGNHKKKKKKDEKKESKFFHEEKINVKMRNKIVQTTKDMYIYIILTLS